jgi:hypothetical protein
MCYWTSLSSKKVEQAQQQTFCTIMNSTTRLYTKLTWMKVQSQTLIILPRATRIHAICPTLMEQTMAFKTKEHEKFCAHKKMNIQSIQLRCNNPE